MSTNSIICKMNLSNYVKNFPRCKRSVIRKELAIALSVSEVYIRSMCSGIKPIPGKFAIRIEEFTKGMVPRHITAPELYPLERKKCNQMNKINSKQ